MKMMHYGEKEFTLTELLIVAAILDIITAVIITNIGTFMTMGTVSAANSEAENVKTASPDYYTDVQEWTADAASRSGNYTFADHYAGEHSRLGITWMMAGVLRVLAIRPLRPLTLGDVRSEYNGIHWENPDAGIGHVEWVRAEE